MSQDNPDSARQRENLGQIEKDEVARAILVQTFSLGGTTEDAAALLTEYFKRNNQPINAKSIVARIVNQVGTKDAYIEHLRGKGISDHALKEREVRVREYLRTNRPDSYWRFDPMAKAIVAAMLGDVQKMYPFLRIIQVLSAYLQSPIKRETFTRTIRQVGRRRLGLPLSGKITDEEQEQVNYTGRTGFARELRESITKDEFDAGSR